MCANYDFGAETSLYWSLQEWDYFRWFSRFQGLYLSCYLVLFKFMHNFENLGWKPLSVSGKSWWPENNTVCGYVEWNKFKIYWSVPDKRSNQTRVEIIWNNSVRHTFIWRVYFCAFQDLKSFQLSEKFKSKERGQLLLLLV